MFFNVHSKPFYFDGSSIALSAALTAVASVKAGGNDSEAN